MRALLKLFVALSGGVVAISLSAHAATLIPVNPVPGSVETDVLGINDNNVIAGMYFTADGVEHGFFGPLNGAYTTFDFMTGGTIARAISNSGYITGVFNNQGNGGHCSWGEFERSPTGAISTINDRHTPLNGVVQGINSSELFVGEYCQPDGTINGYYGKRNRFKASLTLPFTTSWTAPRGISRLGAVVGGYLTAAGAFSGFLLNNGVASTVNYPDPSAAGTFLEGINDKGLVSGTWQDTNGTYWAFIWDMSSNTFTTINLPNSTFAQAFQVNRDGLVALYSNVGSFIYCPKPKSRCPKSGLSAIEVATKPIHASPE